MRDRRGGFIGSATGPAAAGFDSAASGVWTLREAESLKRAGTWPATFSDPTSITGLQLWLDASDAQTLYDATSGGSLVAADGGVARWEDKSGNSRHMTQGTAGSRPARKTAIQGGKDVLRFDGSADFMSVASSTATFAFLHNSTATVFVAYKPSGENPDALYSIIDNCRNGVTVTGYTLFFDDRGGESRNNKILSAGGTAAGNFVVVSADNFHPANTFACITNVIKGQDGTAANRSRLYKNGTIDAAVNTSSGSATGNATHDLMIGAAYTATTNTSFLNGDIAEIIIYDTALSNTDRAAVESYLTTKWVIS
jgi:hypothetical protein